MTELTLFEKYQMLWPQIELLIEENPDSVIQWIIHDLEQFE